MPNRIRLSPPILEETTILSEISCNRPMRMGRIHLSRETLGSKTLIHCLGHGGSGWTTLFASIDKVLSLFLETNPSPRDPIRVIGSGCMGLLCAIELRRRGYRVTGITTKELYDIASWRAPGYFALVSIKTAPEEQENVKEMGIATFRTYQQIAQGKHPFLASNTVRMLPVYCSSETDSGIDTLVTHNLIPPHEEVTLDFGNGIQYPHYRKYMTYFLDVTQIMKQLTHQIHKLAIPVEVKEIHSFNEIAEPIVFNCSGLGGRLLNNDSSIVPVRGHLLMLDKSAGAGHMDYMIYTKDPHFEGKHIYLFPKPSLVTAENIDGYDLNGLLGGTFVPLPENITASELAEIDRENFANLRNRNALFFTGKPFTQ